MIDRVCFGLKCLWKDVLTLGSLSPTNPSLLINCLWVRIWILRSWWKRGRERSFPLKGTLSPCYRYSSDGAPWWRSRCGVSDSHPVQTVKVWVFLWITDDKLVTFNTFYCVLICHPPSSAGTFLTDVTDFWCSIIKLEKVLIIGGFNNHIDDVTCNTAVAFLFII